MPDVSFTDTITVHTVNSTVGEVAALDARARFEVTAPLSAWLDHTEPGFEYTRSRVDPVFYVPGPDPALTPAQRHLLRGALETLAEDGWQAYACLLEAGMPPSLARVALPSNAMLTREVSASALTLVRFIRTHRRFTPGTEIAVIAGGYAAHLAERAPELLFDVTDNPEEEEEL